MLKKKVRTAIIFLYLLLAAVAASYSIYPAHNFNEASPPIISLINPGPDGYPIKWTASTKSRGFGTSDFIFYSNETSTGSLFFMNVSVSNVENLTGWGIGIIYDKTILNYSSAWRPSDHVFRPVEERGWKIVAPDVAFEDINATHKRLMWGYTYMPPEEEELWTFNGSGTLCQIQFRIITDTLAETVIELDREWTTVYCYSEIHQMRIKQIPNVKNALFKYFAKAPQDKGYFWIWVIAVAAVITVASAIFLNFKLKSKKLRGSGKKMKRLSIYSFLKNLPVQIRIQKRLN